MGLRDFLKLVLGENSEQDDDTDQDKLNGLTDVNDEPDFANGATQAAKVASSDYGWWMAPDGQLIDVTTMDHFSTPHPKGSLHLTNELWKPHLGKEIRLLSVGVYGSISTEQMKSLYRLVYSHDFTRVCGSVYGADGESLPGYPGIAASMQDLSKQQIIDEIHNLGRMAGKTAAQENEKATEPIGYDSNDIDDFDTGTTGPTVEQQDIDPDNSFSGSKHGSWSDVQEKATRIRSDGGVRVISVTGPYLAAHVQGDEGVYETTLQRGTNGQIDQWTCSCPWFAYSFGRSGRWKKYEGRMCAHALALEYEAQSQGMFGQDIKEQTETPQWDDKITYYEAPPQKEWRASVSKQSEVFYHGTSRENADSIMENRFFRYPDVTTLTTNPTLAQAYANGTYGRDNGVTLRINIPDQEVSEWVYESAPGVNGWSWKKVFDLPREWMTILDKDHPEEHIAGLSKDVKEAVHLWSTIKVNNQQALPNPEHDGFRYGFHQVMGDASNFRDDTASDPAFMVGEQKAVDFLKAFQEKSTNGHRTLYRAIGLSEAKYQVMLTKIDTGSLDLPPSSWSAERKLVDQFGLNFAQGTMAYDHRIIFVASKGTQSWALGRTSKTSAEREHIVGGRFKVRSVKFPDIDNTTVITLTQVEGWPEDFQTTSDIIDHFVFDSAPSPQDTVKTARPNPMFDQPYDGEVGKWLYHHSDPKHRNSIMRRGLTVHDPNGRGGSARGLDEEEGGGASAPPGVYFGPETHVFGGNMDIWAVDTNKVSLQPDLGDPDNYWGFYYSTEDVPPDALHLISTPGGWTASVHPTPAVLARSGAHDVSDQKRADDGEWTKGGGSSPKSKVRRITENEARGNSKGVTADEFDSLVEKGERRYKALLADKRPLTAFDDDGDWDTVKSSAYYAAQESWGGQTIDPETGEAIDPKTGWSVAIRDPDQVQLSCPEHATLEKFSEVMDEAKELYTDKLKGAQCYLGVFRDDEEHRIDIDPVAVVHSTEDVDAIGAYCHAIGGAYDFATQDGYWVPHVKSSKTSASEQSYITGYVDTDRLFGQGRDPAPEIGQITRGMQVNGFDPAKPIAISPDWDPGYGVGYRHLYLVMDGNHRYYSAVDLGLKEVPAVLKLNHEYDELPGFRPAPLPIVGTPKYYYIDKAGVKKLALTDQYVLTGVPTPEDVVELVTHFVVMHGELPSEKELEHLKRQCSFEEPLSEEDQAPAGLNLIDYISWFCTQHGKYPTDEELDHLMAYASLGESQNDPSENPTFNQPDSDDPVGSPLDEDGEPQSILPGAQATLNDEPEGALPETDGTSSEPDETYGSDEQDNTHLEGGDQGAGETTIRGGGDTTIASRAWLDPSNSSEEVKVDEMDISKAAKDYLMTSEAVKTFTFAEQQEIINEGDGTVTASNLDQLKLEGTHYEALEAQLAHAEEIGESVLWW